MNLLLRVSAFAVLILVSNILCNTRSNMYYQKCQEYQAEDESLDENAMNPHVQVEVLEKLCVGTIISPDTILVVSDVQEVTVDSFKVYLKPGDNDSFLPEAFFTNDRFIVLKMSDVLMEQFPRRRACLQIEFPPNSVLHVMSNDEHNNFITMVGRCTKQEHLATDICVFKNMFADQPIPNNSVVLHINYPQVNIVGSYSDNQLPLINLIDEDAAKWIESVTWSTTASGTNLKQCGQVKLPLSPLGSFGTLASVGEFPWHAGIFYSSAYICGGTIISTRAIVTAARCVHNKRGVTTAAHLLNVKVGLHNRVNPDAQCQKIQVQSVTPYPDFDITFFEYDIAVLRVAELIVYTNFVQPICIENTVRPKLMEGVVPGWGKNERGINQNNLQKAALVMQSTRECRNHNGGYLRTYLSVYNFCAAYKNSTFGCTGDYGGGLVVMEDGVWVLRGIMSLGKVIKGTKRCDATYFSLFTNTTYLYNWIMDESDQLH